MQVLNYNEIFQNCAEDLSRTHAYIRLQEVLYGNVEIQDEDYVEFDTNGRLETLERPSLPARLMSKLKNRSRRPETVRRTHVTNKLRAKLRNAVNAIFSSGTSHFGRTGRMPKSSTKTGVTSGKREDQPHLLHSTNPGSVTQTVANHGPEPAVLSKSPQRAAVQDSREVNDGTISLLSVSNNEAKPCISDGLAKDDCKRVKCTPPGEEQGPFVQPGFVARAINSLSSTVMVETESSPAALRARNVLSSEKKRLEQGPVQTGFVARAINFLSSPDMKEAKSHPEALRDGKALSLKNQSLKNGKELQVAGSEQGERHHAKEIASLIEPGFVARAIQSLASAGLTELEEDLLRMKKTNCQGPEIQVSNIERSEVFAKELGANGFAHHSNNASQSVRSESPVSLIEEDVSDPPTIIQHKQFTGSKPSQKTTVRDEFKPGYVARVVDSLNYYIDHESCESPPELRSTGALFSLTSQ